RRRQSHKRTNSSEIFDSSYSGSPVLSLHLKGQSRQKRTKALCSNTSFCECGCKHTPWPVGHAGALVGLVLYLRNLRLNHRFARRVFVVRPFLFVFAFLSTRSFQAVCRAPVSTSSLAAASRMCVIPIRPQPPGMGRKTSGSSSTNAACCSSVSIRFP